jgi:hypothetical protein
MKGNSRAEEPLSHRGMGGPGPLLTSGLYITRLIYIYIYISLYIITFYMYMYIYIHICMYIYIKKNKSIHNSPETHLLRVGKEEEKWRRHPLGSTLG